MFKKLFKRKNKGAAEDPALDLRSQRPGAGEIRTLGLNETLFLAPLPVYTGQVQIGRRNFSEMNDTYLELGGNNRGMVEQGKLLAFGIWLVLILAFGSPLFLASFLTLFSSPEIERDFFALLMLGLQWGLTHVLPPGILGIGAYMSGVVSGVRASTKTYPVRFNRQRREVGYIDSTSHRVLIVPWESVVAWVANSQGVTPYGATRQYTFGMGLEDEERDTVQFLLLPQPSDAHALGMWTAIRNYMEDGQLVDAPNPMLTILGLTPTEDELKPYEGLHTFEIERKGARFMGSLDDAGADLTAEERKRYGYPKRTPWPLRRWYIWRVLSFWKMPYLLAEWGHRVGRPTLPEQVQAWSHPLPSEQWAKPSPALQKANSQVKTAMDQKGATFVDACKAAGLH